MSKLPNDDGGGILIPLLASLLVVVGIGTAGLFGYFGFIASQNDKVPQDQTIEADQSESGGSSAPQSSTGISYAGPGILIEDGEVTRRHEDDQKKDLPNQTQTSQDIDVLEQPTDDQKTQTEPPAQTTDDQTGQKDNGTSNSGQTGTGKTPENQQQSGVNLDPSSPSASGSQDSGTNVVTKPSGRTVYITPTGKRYHYDGNCNGGTYIESTLDEVNRLNLTPCNKCVN